MMLKEYYCTPIFHMHDCMIPFFFLSARILRAIRIAARLGFSISRETAQSVKNLSYSVLRLDRVFKVIFISASLYTHMSISWLSCPFYVSK